MELIVLGVDFPHAKGEFCCKRTETFYTVCCFATDFVYWKNSEMCRGKKGDILINTPGNLVYHGPCPNAEEGFVNDWLHIDGEDFGALLEKYPLPLNQAFSVSQAYFFRKYTASLMKEYVEKPIGWEDCVSCLITEMIIDTWRTYNNLHDFETPYRSIKALRSSILKNPEKKWTLEEMSHLCGYSVSRFSELYRKLYGKAPIEDIIALRLDLAKRLLASGQASVSYAAAACGFNTINYFSKYFKKTVGCTPSEYMTLFER